MRTERSVDELQKLSEDLREAAEVIEEIADDMQSRNISSISIHSVTQFSRDVPSLLAWSYKVAAEWKVQSLHGNGRSGNDKTTQPSGADAARGGGNPPTA